MSVFGGSPIERDSAAPGRTENTSGTHLPTARNNHGLPVRREMRRARTASPKRQSLEIDRPASSRSSAHKIRARREQQAAANPGQCQGSPWFASGHRSVLLQRLLRSRRSGNSRNRFQRERKVSRPTGIALPDLFPGNDSPLVRTPAKHCDCSK